MQYTRYPESELDYLIHRMQDELHSKLPCMLFISNDQYNCFGRVYRNLKPTGNGYKPEFYSGDGEYKDTLLDDKYALTSFFGLGDTVTEDGTDNVADVHCVFFVNLGRVKFRDREGNPQIMSGRGDLEVRQAAHAVLGQNLFGFRVTSVQTGPNALREYDIQRGGTNSTELNRWDMHPWHVFRVNGTLRWSKPNISNFDLNN